MKKQFFGYTLSVLCALAAQSVMGLPIPVGNVDSSLFDGAKMTIPAPADTNTALMQSKAFNFAARFAPSAMAPVIGAGEMLVLTKQLPGRQLLESASWHYEIGSVEGSVLLQRREGADIAQGVELPVTDLEAKVRKDVDERLRMLGIPDAERQPVQLRYIRQALRSDNGAPVKDNTIALKAFVFRSLAGVELPQSRLVLTYGTDGRLRRIYGRWPTLAESGHLLNTALNRQQVIFEVAAAMQQKLLGETLSRLVPVRLVYREAPAGDGTVRLALQAEAAVFPERAGGMAQPYAELVSLSR